MMSAQQKIVECSLCGHKMVIPPEYANTPGKCSVCGAMVNTGEVGLPRVMLDDDISGPSSASKASSRKPVPPPPPDWRREMIRASLFGCIGALAGGAVTTLAMMMAGRIGFKVSTTTVIASADTGLSIGFVFFTLWSVVRRLRLGAIKATLLGAAISTVLGLAIYYIEATFVAAPDSTAAQNAVVALLGGGLTGFILAEYAGMPD